MDDERMWFLIGAVCIPSLVLLTSFWILSDAKQIGVRRGLLIGSGIPDAGPWGWFFGSLLIWIIAFPLYLFFRSRLIKAARESSGQVLDGSCAAGGSPLHFDDELRRLAQLRDEGVISGADFDLKKKAILDNLIG